MNNLSLAMAWVAAALMTLAAPATGMSLDHPRNAALMGDDVFFEIGEDAFLVPLAALRYPSALRAPIFQFYFDAPIEGVSAQLMALDSVSCNYSVAHDHPQHTVSRRAGHPAAGLPAAPVAPGSASVPPSFVAGVTRYGLESYRRLPWPGRIDGAQAAIPAEDWFILRDGQRLVRTLIRCGSDEPGTGGAAMRIAFCTHVANIDPARGERLRLRYPRAYLGGWRDIQRQVESRVREFKQRGRAAVPRRAADR